MKALLPVTIAALLPIAALAQATPTAFAERAQTVTAGQEVNLYGLYTRDEAGVLRCYDVTMTVPVGANGKPGASAPIESTACPKIKKGSFVVGSYVATSASSYSCSLEASSFVGRSQYDLYCTESSYPYRRSTYTWFSDPIKGNPLEDQLLAQGLNTVPGSSEYAWGNMSAATSQSGTNYTCFDFHELLSARQVGDRLTLVNYGSDTTVDCPLEFIKTAP